MIALTDVAVNVRRTWSHNDWGLSTGGVDNGNFGGAARVQWKGALLNGNVGGGGLYYMRHRWYEPRSGRFLSEDPIGLAGGLNKYKFTSNDPVNAADPSGLCSGCIVSIGGSRGVPIKYKDGAGGVGTTNPGLDWTGDRSCRQGNRRAFPI